MAGLAYENGDPGADLIMSLEQAGMGDVKHQACYGGSCNSQVDHPLHFTEGLKVAGHVGLRYRFEEPFSVEALLSNGPRGHAEGFNSDRRETLVVSHASVLLTSTVGLHLGPIRLSAGPVVNRTVWGVTRNSATVTDGRGIWSVGGTAGLSAGMRMREVLLSLSTGVRFFPEQDLRGELQVPVQAGYRTLFIGVTASPWGD